MDPVIFLLKYFIFSIIWMIYWIVKFHDDEDFPNMKKASWILLPVLIPSVSYLLFYW
jgi:hypothetical protein